MRYHSLFWDVGTDVSSGPGNSARQAESAVRELEDRIDRLSMICCAMWTVLQAHSGVSDEELATLVQELDLADGTMDGKAKIEQVGKCPKCHRPVANRHVRCIYCGTERKSSNPFDNVL